MIGKLQFHNEQNIRNKLTNKILNDDEFLLQNYPEFYWIKTLSAGNAFGELALE